MSNSNDYRPDPQDGFTADDELLHNVMLEEFGVDGDYEGYDDYLDLLACYEPVDFTDSWE
jgi:hypothetical protein